MSDPLVLLWTPFDEVSRIPGLEAAAVDFMDGLGLCRWQEVCDGEGISVADAAALLNVTPEALVAEALRMEVVLADDGSGTDAQHGVGA